MFVWHIMSFFFAGEIYRPCTAQGVWNPPVYNCVRKELKDIEKQVYVCINTLLAEKSSKFIFKMKQKTPKL